MDFLIINGQVVSKKEANLTEFLWDEPFILSQKVWFGFGGIPLFHENISSIERQLNTFNLSLPTLFKNKRELFRLTKRMLNKNKFYRSGFVNYQFFISDKKINTLITCTAFPEFEYTFSKNGLLVDISDLKKNSHSVTGRFKIHNQTLWKAAQTNAVKTAWQGSILLNEKEKVCEGLESNIYMVKNDVLITPSLGSGCYEDTFRPIILELGKSLNLKVAETPELQKEHLFSMDEIFFASEEKGIQWVLGIQSKRFVHEYSDEIHYKLNAFLKDKII
ncbi:aminotransferase class IV [Prolixibacteraceae bacterium Z1-6]|uniref:Aminotransferase class IV n=1 Tax=Draconibacterium aestuarii TaxID=2998507 RepID=A0A9X3F380_9BACT|nr:aminotransferase class IV [Prolixibacteraceae bacterium Z1-6]